MRKLLPSVLLPFGCWAHERHDPRADTVHSGAGVAAVGFKVERLRTEEVQRPRLDYSREASRVVQLAHAVRRILVGYDAELEAFAVCEEGHHFRHRFVVLQHHVRGHGEGCKVPRELCRLAVVDQVQPREPHVLHLAPHHVAELHHVADVDMGAEVGARGEQVLQRIAPARRRRVHGAPRYAERQPPGDDGAHPDCWNGHACLGAAWRCLRPQAGRFRRAPRTG
mmetsp:Transcript_2833/g.7012  ORF Transcript_2833/g.7012 Transcript_2833/m.7012 type:complete len:224 (-) Transcript_2833:311-982(-)